MDYLVFSGETADFVTFSEPRVCEVRGSNE